jgi:exodeoxyribonuclease-3
VRKDCNDPKASAAIGRIIAIQLSPLQTLKNNNSNSLLPISIMGTYVPNSGRMEVHKLDYRTKQWDPALSSLLNHLKQTSSVIWCGDINVAPQDIDVTHPKTMKNYAGFTPQERANFQKFISIPIEVEAKKNAFEILLKSKNMTEQWVDVWRYLNPKKCGYSWHSDKIPEKPQVRSEMRLDNIIVTQNLLSKIKSAQIHNDIQLSDHSPISLSLTI